jgi:hypothetical protein
MANPGGLYGLKPVAGSAWRVAGKSLTLVVSSAEINIIYW